MSEPTLPAALLVACKLPESDELEFQSSLSELERLVATLGYRVVDRVTQTRSQLSPAAVLGEGKLEELAQLAGAPSDGEDEDDLDERGEDDPDRVELVAVDHELSPSQLRNLERVVKTNVLDRTGVIIEIFHRHARSREAKLQVEIARLHYAAPRLRESPRGKERQAGRGAGEAGLELDRRRIRDRIAELRQELEAVQRLQSVRRAQRQDLRRVALVGYTNAGKSSLMRALTGSSVYVEDKLFATLDTTVRALSPETKPRILISDTVGFIKHLPHDLVASFKSTLDEALEASLLLHVVDASDPNWRSELEVTRSVLEEIGAAEVPRRLVMNKLDRVSAEAADELRRAFPDAWFISAKNPEDVAWVHGQIVAHFEADYVEAELLVPYARQKLVSQLHESARVLTTEYAESGVVVRVRAPAETLASIRAELAQG
jgi:GTP-binding protein HflX